MEYSLDAILVGVVVIAVIIMLLYSIYANKIYWKRQEEALDRKKEQMTRDFHSRSDDEAAQCEDTWDRFMALEIELPVHPVVLEIIYDTLQFQISQGLPMASPFGQLLHIMNRSDTEKYSALMDCYPKEST